MPLIVVTGRPCVGKTVFSLALAEFLENAATAPAAGRPSNTSLTTSTAVVLVNDESAGTRKSTGYADARSEKLARGALKAGVERALHSNAYVIADGLNYIKGFRYELFRVARGVRTNHVVVHVRCALREAERRNAVRMGRVRHEAGAAPDSTIGTAGGGDGYPTAIMSDLWVRYEDPEPRNRWDSPLINVVSSLSAALGCVDLDTGGDTTGFATAAEAAAAKASCISEPPVGITSMELGGSLSSTSTGIGSAAATPAPPPTKKASAFKRNIVATPLVAPVLTYTAVCTSMSVELTQLEVVTGAVPVAGKEASDERTTADTDNQGSLQNDNHGNDSDCNIIHYDGDEGGGGYLGQSDYLNLDDAETHWARSHQQQQQQFGDNNSTSVARSQTAAAIASLTLNSGTHTSSASDGLPSNQRLPVFTTKPVSLPFLGNSSASVAPGGGGVYAETFIDRNLDLSSARMIDSSAAPPPTAASADCISAAKLIIAAPTPPPTGTTPTAGTAPTPPPPSPAARAAAAAAGQPHWAAAFDAILTSLTSCPAYSLPLSLRSQPEGPDNATLQELDRACGEVVRGVLAAAAREGAAVPDALNRGDVGGGRGGGDEGGLLEVSLPGLAAPLLLPRRSATPAELGRLKRQVSREVSVEVGVV